MTNRLTSFAIAMIVFAAFTAFSLWVVATRGYFGFLILARDEPWALQMFLDLVIALGFALSWMIHDARRRGIAWWPYAIAIVPLGSIGVLAYLVRRPFSRVR